MTWLLNLFGKRDRSYFVFHWQGTIWFQHRRDCGDIKVSDVIDGPMSREKAERLARSLRHKAENTPRDVM